MGEPRTWKCLCGVVNTAPRWCKRCHRRAPWGLWPMYPRGYH